MHDGAVSLWILVADGVAVKNCETNILNIGSFVTLNGGNFVTDCVGGGGSTSLPNPKPITITHNQSTDSLGQEIVRFNGSVPLRSGGFSSLKVNYNYNTNGVSHQIMEIRPVLRS